MVWCCNPIKNLIEISLPALYFVYFEIATYISTLKYVININSSILATSKNYKWIGDSKLGLLYNIRIVDRFCK